MLKTAVKGIAGSLGYDVIRRNSGAATVSRGLVARFRANGQDVAFFVENEWDYIQKHHLGGRFYETEELALIGKHVESGVFVDVGANVGNHTVYALKILGLEKVIAFEPNPEAARLLAVNAALNGVSARLDHRLAGLSDAPGIAQIVAPSHKDLGSTRLALVSGHGSGACAVTTGDEALADVPAIAMIKIDTEAMELSVLRGLRDTLARTRPKLFVEVDDANREAFLSLVDGYGYDVVDTYQRYAANCNFLLTPRV